MALTSGQTCTLAVLALAMTWLALWPILRRWDRQRMSRGEYDRRLGQLDAPYTWDNWTSYTYNTTDNTKETP